MSLTLQRQPTEEEAKQREKTRQAQAERQQDKQELKDKGVLGGLTDNLTGR